jgi:hypothetical protein
MLHRTCRVAVLLAAVSVSAHAKLNCPDVLKALRKDLVDVTCFASTDLTTKNEQTTPLNNSNPALPAFAFTPRTDRDVISPNAPERTRIDKAVPGLQIQARIAGDPRGQARFLLRLPADWNGRLVVAGASGTRSEFNGDFAWSDYVVQKGYAYASQNKGIFNLQFVAPTDPLACRLNPDSALFVRFYANEPGQVFTRWTEFMVKAGQLAREGANAAYGQPPRYIYAVGTSNGGYQVRRAIETAPQLFDGGVDWEGTFVDAHAPNLLTDLPPAVLNFPDYRASKFDTTTTAAKNIVAAGYPPDIKSDLGTPTIPAKTTTLWDRNWAQFWEVTLCQWQKRLDPTYDTYGSGTGTYNYINRLSFSNVGAEMAAFANSGAVRRPLVTVAGTMDALLPIDHHARAYARKVAAASKNKGDGDDDERDDKRSAYRLYEVQNGNHIETYKQDFFSQLEFIQPHAQRAFDLVVQQVERGATLPPSQCIPRGGSISDSPGRPEHCANLFVP